MRGDQAEPVAILRSAARSAGCEAVNTNLFHRHARGLILTEQASFAVFGCHSRHVRTAPIPLARRIPRAAEEEVYWRTARHHAPGLWPPYGWALPAQAYEKIPRTSSRTCAGKSAVAGPSYA